MDKLFAAILIRRVPAFLGAVALLIGLGAGPIPAPRLPGITPSVALGFGLLGAAVLGTAAWGARFRWVARGLALSGLLFSLPSGLKALPSLGPLAGLIQVWPAEMPLNNALAFVCGSLSLLTTSTSLHRRRKAWSAWFAVSVIVLALVSLLATLFGAAPVQVAAEPVRMAWPPAVVHLLLGGGLLLLRPADDFMGFFLADNVVGIFARRMIAAMLLFPLGLALIRFQLLRYVEFSSRDSLAVFTVISMLAVTVVTLWAARIAGGLQEQREAAMDEQQRLLARLEEQAAGLQEQVAVRTRELQETNRNLQSAARTNSRLSLVASHTTSGVLIADAQWKIEWVNEAWQHLTGYTFAEVVGRKPGQLLSGPGTNPVTSRQLSEAVRQGQACYVEILNYAKGGRPFWQILDIEPVHDEAGKLVNFISVQTDITQYRESQQQLEGLTKRLQQALLFSGYGVWEMDLGSDHIVWDPRMLEIFGFNAGRFDSRLATWLQCVHPDDRARVEGQLSRAAVTTISSFEIEYSIIRPADGQMRQVKSQGYIQRDAQNAGPRLIGLLRDITDDHRQQEQLLTYTERLQLALQASGYGVWDLNNVGGQLYWDVRQAEIHGVEPASAPGSYQAWVALVHPEDRDRFQAPVQAVFSSSEEFTNEYRIVRPDGQIRHVEAHGYLRRDATGRLIRTVGMDRDITAEKEMQEALRLAEERWQLALTGTNDGVWDWNVVSGSMFFDQRYAAILGQDLADLPEDDRSWMVLIHPEDRTEALAARAAHLDGATTLYAMEHRIQTQLGEWKWVLGRGRVVSRDGAGRALRMVGTLSDISVRKQQEQTLRRSQELAEHVDRLAMIGGWDYYPTSQELYWSSCVRRIHEVSDDYVPTTATALAFFAPEVRGKIEEASRLCLNEDKPYDLELPLITATGRRIWVRTLGRAEFKHGLLIRVFGVFQDITVRYETEQSRQQLEKQLFQAQKMDTLGTLAGGIAHDFNNLLTGIMGYHDLATDLLPEEHPVRGYLNESRQASLRARQLVEQILTFSRQEESPEHISIDLGLLMTEVRRFLRATLPTTIQIQVEVEADSPRVLADSTQIHQILLNLGTNGAQAMSERGGVLQFGLKTMALDAFRAAALGGLSAGRYVCLSVSDWGHGMDDITLKRIFDPFFTTKKPGEGTGLGLSVVHGIVRSHQGGIEVESAVGIGTTFRIFLPEAGSEAQLHQLKQAAAGPGHGETIYLVDDEEVVARFAGIALERMGFKVVIFDSALPCLEAIQSDPASCQVLVTDQTMPGLTGTELIEGVHKIKPSCGAVLMSGYFTKISTHTLDRLSHVELLKKPFTSEELAIAVQRALDVSAARTAAANGLA